MAHDRCLILSIRMDIFRPTAFSSLEQANLQVYIKQNPLRFVETLDSKVNLTFEVIFM